MRGRVKDALSALGARKSAAAIVKQAQAAEDDLEARRQRADELSRRSKIRVRQGRTDEQAAQAETFAKVVILSLHKILVAQYPEYADPAMADLATRAVADLKLSAEDVLYRVHEIADWYDENKPKPTTTEGQPS